MDEVVELENMENVCRLCLSTDEPKSSVFGKQGSPVSLAAKIQTCLSIQILATDRLSTEICAQCVKNVNRWHNYKEACLRSQDKLHQWLEKQWQSSPMVITIKDEPVDLDFYEDNIEIISETTLDSDLESATLEHSMSNTESDVHIQILTDDEIDLENDQPAVAKDPPALTNDHPVVTIDEPALTNDHPVVTIEEPMLTIDEPALTNDHPVVTIEEPMVTIDESTLTTDEPALAKDQPALAKDQPALAKDQPALTIDEPVLAKEQPALANDMDVCIVKQEPQVEYDTDCTIEIESVTGNEVALKTSSNTEDRVMEADSTQKPTTSIPAPRKRARRGPHTHYRGARIYKKKCVHCQIHLHSKHAYTKHMERFHSEAQTGDTGIVQLQDEEELIEDLEDELISMEKDSPLTQVQQNIISQLKTFSCYSCQQSYSDRKSTLAHIRQHMPDLRPFTCIACLTEFPDRSMYKLHCGASFECAMKIALVVPNHGDEKYFTCNMCLRSMQNRKELLSHLSKHSDKQYEELISPSRSPPKLKPMTHLPPPKLSPPKVPQGKSIPHPYKNGDPVHNHVCDLCGMIYRYRTNMLKHRDLCLRLVPEVRTSYKCVHCGKTYLVFQKFHSHITQEHNKRELNCSECSAKFRSPSDYLLHHETHRVTRNKKQGSEKKNDSSKSSSTISTAIKDWDMFEAKVNASKIPSGKQYSCALCNLEFSSRADLTEHRNLHLKVKIYSCVICRSMFSSAGALEIHMKDHGIEDPNERNANSSCVEYGNVDDDSQDSATVNASATSDSGTNKNECEQCGKVFSNYANVRRHVRTVHKPGKPDVVCKMCSRTFKSRELCNRHMLIEHKTNKVMLQCPQCPKSFVFLANLDLHFQTVHGERSQAGHKCEICGKAFVEEASLKTHRSWHRRANSRLSLQYSMNGDQKPDIISLTPKRERDANLDRPPRARKSFPNPPPTKPQGNFQCQVCNDKFNDVTELRKHLWDVHCARNKTEKSFSSNELQCELCTNVYPDKETLDMHMQWHKAYPILSDIKKPMISCDVCGKQYSSKKVLWRHKKLHKTVPVATMKLESNTKKATENQNMCDICQKVFCSIQSMQRHKMNLHSELLKQERSQPPVNNSRRSSQEEPKWKKLKVEVEEDHKGLFNTNIGGTGKKSVMCHVCKKFFANMSVLYKHKQQMHNKNRFVKNIVKQGKGTKNECIPLPGSDGNVCCNICFKEFPGVTNLRHHFAGKHKNTPTKYTCSAPGCKLTFPTAVGLKNHEVTHTSTILNCNLCNRHVFSREAMVDHMLKVHSTVYDSEKSKIYHREADLTTYEVAGAVDATCPKCKIKYPNNRSMKIHYFKFHEDAGQA